MAGRREALEGDGLIDVLYDFLWQKNAQGRSCPGILLPETIVYKYRQPAYWYFSSAKDGLIKKKNKQKLTNASIFECLTKERDAQSEICAYHIATRDGEAGEAARVTTVEYLDEERLKHFLFHRDKLNNGILQRFFDPPELHNTVIRATWSPGVCLLEKRSSGAKLGDRRASMAARAATFEGAEGGTEAGPMSGAQLAGHVTQLCANVVEHVAEVARSCRIARMVLYFKPDRAGRIHLLWCSSLRLHPPAAPGSSLLPPTPLAPLDVAHTLTLAEPPVASASHHHHAGPALLEAAASSHGHGHGHGHGGHGAHGTAGGRRSAAPEARACPACGKPFGEAGEFEVSYKQVLMHADAASGGPRRVAVGSALPLDLEPPSALFEEAILGQRPDKGDRWRSHHRARPALSSASSGPAPDPADGVPEALRRLHPGLTSAQLGRLAGDAAFLYKTARVCCTCAVAITRTATRALAADEPPRGPRARSPRRRAPRAPRPTPPASAPSPPGRRRTGRDARPAPRGGGERAAGGAAGNAERGGDAGAGPPRRAAGQRESPPHERRGGHGPSGKGSAGRAWMAARAATFTPDYSNLAGDAGL
eukprot:tig00001067_g6783.t1